MQFSRCCMLLPPCKLPNQNWVVAGRRPGGSLPQGGYGNQQPPHNPPLASESVEELRAPSDQTVGLLHSENGWTVEFCALAKLSQPVFNPVGHDHSWIFRLLTEQAEANMDQDQSCLVLQPMGELRRVKTSMKRTNEKVGGWLKERKGIVGRFYAKKSPEIATRKVQRRGLSKAQISGNTMSIGLKELTVDRGELSSTFFASALRW